MEQNGIRAYLVVSSAIFGVVAAIHLLRALNDWAFQVGSLSVPVVVSWVGFVLTAALCAWAIRLVTR